MEIVINKNNFINAIDELGLTQTQKMRLAHHLLGQCLPDEGVESVLTPSKDITEDYEFVVPKCKKLKPKNQQKLINTIKGFYRTKKDGISNRTVEKIIVKMKGDGEIFIDSKGLIDWLKD
jgi:hypothetical protein